MKIISRELIKFSVTDILANTFLFITLVTYLMLNYNETIKVGYFYIMYEYVRGLISAFIGFSNQHGQFINFQTSIFNVEEIEKNIEKRKMESDNNDEKIKNWQRIDIKNHKFCL